jgi:hypothetical protein
VIDINKLPRYGVLAPPIERPERQAGKYVDLDMEQDLFVKNRGVLREAVENKTGEREKSIEVVKWVIVHDVVKRVIYFAVHEVLRRFIVHTCFSDLAIAQLPHIAF